MIHIAREESAKYVFNRYCCKESFLSGLVLSYAGLTPETECRRDEKRVWSVRIPLLIHGLPKICHTS